MKGIVEAITAFDGEQPAWLTITLYGGIASLRLGQEWKGKVHSLILVVLALCMTKKTAKN